MKYLVHPGAVAFYASASSSQRCTKELEFIALFAFRIVGVEFALILVKAPDW